MVSTPLPRTPPLRLVGSGDDAAPTFMDVRQVAEYLHINTKKVYALASEGKMPGTKVTGKWLFPRKLIDHWLLESSHGGLLTDRLVVTGSDDPLIQRSVYQVVHSMQGRALVSYTCTSTELGLSLLARNRADVCGVRWGPAEESHNRHAALIQHYPPHKNWVLVRAFQREQGLILAPGIFDAEPDLERLFSSDLRWVFRHDGAGAQRHLRELFGHHQVDPARLTVAARVLSEREVASLLSRDEADVAPGTRSTAGEFGLDFLPIGWEAYDFALDRGVYFRALFQNVINFLKSSECQRIAERFGGYDFSDCGQIVWSA